MSCLIKDIQRNKRFLWRIEDTKNYTRCWNQAVGVPFVGKLQQKQAGGISPWSMDVEFSCHSRKNIVCYIGSQAYKLTPPRRLQPYSRVEVKPLRSRRKAATQYACHRNTRDNHLYTRYRCLPGTVSKSTETI